MNIDIQVLEKETQGRYRFLRLLGKGSFGTVFAAEDLKTGKNVAIKRITRLFNSVLDMKRMLREIKILSCLHHENITNLIDVTAPSSFSNFHTIYLIIEIMETDLYRLMQSPQRLTLDHHQYFMYQLLRGLKYIHSAKIVHRDIKPENLFLNNKSQLKIGDFGLARIVDDPFSAELQNETIVTRWYRAPEVLLNIKNYGEKIDIWSAGCVLGELMLGKPLFEGQSNINMLTLIVNLLGSPTYDDLRQITNTAARTFMDSLPQKNPVPFQTIFKGSDPQEIDLLSKMLTWNPDRRIDVEKALKHPFFQRLHDPFEEPVAVPMKDFDFEKPEVTMEQLKQLLWEQIIHFHPEFK
ncbi:CMGC family protein kinase [Tritrichomonas foetus]|uniref:Mitogen-activated protein kinase n=1 Tax=Tritrichomonas foetus TaxID=1144522 RepID=A0A1J4KZ42_9EUKA|nr:CMGC family protein kinase [Tritrichomonas foetus]|eukprot:OHT14964.1 CMGC family protein kinase [Tritrichomonas foetus]